MSYGRRDWGNIQDTIDGRVKEWWIRVGGWRVDI